MGHEELMEPENELNHEDQDLEGSEDTTEPAENNVVSSEGANSKNQNLQTVSENRATSSTSQDENEEEEDYETADSGVSENSSISKSEADQLPSAPETEVAPDKSELVPETP